MPKTKTRNAEIDIEIGRMLRAARTLKSLSQGALGKSLGVSFQQFGKFETGQNRLSVSSLIVLCRTLDINPMDIIGQFFDQPSQLVTQLDQVTVLKSKIAAARAALA